MRSTLLYAAEILFVGDDGNREGYRFLRRFPSSFCAASRISRRSFIQTDLIEELCRAAYRSAEPSRPSVHQVLLLRISAHELSAFHSDIARSL